MGKEWEWDACGYFCPIYLQKSQPLSVAVSSIKLRTYMHAHTHTQSKMRIKAFRLGVLSSSNYSSEAPNYTVQNQLKRRQHYMEKLKQVGEEEAEGPLKSTST